MSRRSPLPPSLVGAPFTTSTAQMLGLSRSRLRAADISAPFRGVRMPVELAGDRDARIAALALRLPDGAAFSHSTAALVLGIPLPASSQASPALHVSVIEPARSVRIRGVIGHQLKPMPEASVVVAGTPLLAPEVVWTQLAAGLSVADLVAAGDALLTAGLTIDRLEAAVDRRPGLRGITTARAALALVRVGSRSRPETHGRLLFRAAGLPEPEINGVIRDRHGAVIALGDLVWRAYRQVWEYEGDHHRTDRRQFRHDVIRRERVEDEGWRLMRSTAPDLASRAGETVLRMGSRLGIAVPPARVTECVRLAHTFGR